MQQTKRVKDPSKQRKSQFNAPAHIRHKRMGAQLSKTLAAQKGVRTLPVRKGDTVRIERGDNKGFEGKVSRVDLKTYRIYLEGLTREKVDGTNIFLSVHPSKVQIRTLSLDDKWRKDIVLPRKKAIEKPEKAEKQKAAKKEANAEKAVEKVLEEKEKAPVKKPAAKKPAAKKATAPAVEAAPAEDEAKKAPAKLRTKKKAAAEKTEGEQ
jgi:large subunit ribosomal protein L24